MKVVRTLSICTFLLSLVAAAGALNPDRDIHQLMHRSWGEEDGYPGRTEDLAQTTDGFLWLGTDDGLFRFDGAHFERYVSRSGDKLSDGPVRGLRAISDGSLWIAYRLENKICVLRNGNLKCYGNADGVTSYPDAIVQDHEGTLWANTWNGLIRFNGTRWERIGNEWNFPEDVPEETSGALFVDSRGTLWTGVNHTVLYLKQGSKRFEPTGVFAGYSNSIAEALDGMIWLSDNLGYVRAISTSVSAKSAAIAKCEVETPSGTAPNCPGEGPTVIKLRHAGSLLFDRNGSLWMTCSNSGVFRVPHPERLAERLPVRVNDRRISKTSEVLQNFTSKDGLSSDSGAPVLEDREGNIWVATRDGLDQFRDGALVPIALPKSLIRVAIAPADGGDLWGVGSWAYVARIRADSSNISLVPADAFKAYRDAAGVTWLLGDSLEQWKDGAFRKMAPSPYGFLTGPGTWQVAGDRFGRLWAFSNGHGFFSLGHNRWKAWATPAEVAKLHVADMFCDSTDLIWVSTYEGDVITLDKGEVEDYPVKSDSPLRNVKAFAERAPHEVWVGGAGGLALIDSGRIRPIKPEALDSLNDVTGVVDAGSEGLWLNTANGVIHVSKDEVDRALRDPSYRFQEELFDSSDGLPGQSEAIYPYPKAVQGTDGRIWFTAARGVAWIDPKSKTSRNAIPPPVSITSVSADGSPHLQLADLRLPAHTANVQIRYTALSLSVPERVHFRYKLEGSDRDWLEVGARREAFYTNLGPRHYRFRVIACNQDGIWNNVGAVVEFTIAPAWYQTLWFRLCCLAALLLLLWAAYLFRVRHLEAQFAAGLEVRVDERTRIARDLHDTLLQSFNALLLRLQTVSNVLPAQPDEAKQRIDRAIEQASDAITEGRDTVNELRSSGSTTLDLDQAISNFARELLSGSALEPVPEVHVRVEGTPKPLNPIVRDEVYRIVTEALHNAIRHANAGRIEVEIRYDEHQLRLRIGDNGTGIDAAILDRDHKPGHWGLRGMRERAKSVGGTVEVWSQIDIGTEIELSIPAASVYATSPTARWSVLSRFGRS
jgi:signal transduction histidine kinase/ligand-binding sensor domain-containing protein